MLTLWDTAIKFVYDLYGEPSGDFEIMPEHLYYWTVTSPGWTFDMRTHDNERVPYTLMSFFLDRPEDGWETYYVHVADALKRLNKKTLYVGAGTGRYLKFLENQGVEHWGIDISDPALDLMARRGVTNVEKMDGAAMSFGDNSFPLVYIPEDALNYSVSPEVLIAEACRVASQTVVLGSERNGSNPTDRPTGHNVTMEWMGITDSFIYTGYPSDYFDVLLLAHGFEVDRVLDHFGNWILEAHAV